MVKVLINLSWMLLCVTASSFSAEINDTTTLDSTIWSKNLEAVTVVAKKPLVKTDIDKLTYDVASDPQAQTNTVLEILRKVPLVTIDGQDNIKVNNSSSFKVYVNGKPNNMMSNNPSEVFKSIPANSIKKIEVITNPGPKYDAEGVGGILNIVTLGHGMEGYTATVGTSVNSQGGVGGNIFGTIQQGKLTVSGNYSDNYSNQPTKWSGSNNNVTGDVNASSANITTDKTTKSHARYQWSNLEASYEIDTLHLVTASFGLLGGNGRGDIENTTSGVYPTDGRFLYRYSNFINTKQSMYSIDGSFDYQRSFRQKGRLLTFSYKINTNPNKTDDYNTYYDMKAANAWTTYLHRLKNQHHNQNAHTTEQTFQIDYTTPIGKLHTIEAGIKYIMRNNKSIDNRYIKENQDDINYTHDEKNSSHYKHINNILATYFGYGLMWKKFSGRLGFRYEHTIQNVKYLLGRGDDFHKNLDDFVPSASVGLHISDAVSFRLGYNLRVYRPGIWYLNPYIDDSNPTNIKQGNSNLKSEKSHIFTLGFNMNTYKFSLNMNSYTSFTNNSIEEKTSLIKDTEIIGLDNPTGKDVLYTTYQNIGKTKETGINAYINWNILKDTRIYSSLNGSYNDYSDGMTLKNHGWQASTFTGIEQVLPKDWRISFNYYGRTPWIALQGKGQSYSDYSITINKSFLDKRLNFSLYVGSFLRKYNYREGKIESQNFSQVSWSKSTDCRIKFAVSYRLGSLKATVKKVERSIENTDIKENKEK